MSVVELQKKIGRLTPRERRSVAKFVTYLQRRETPARKRALARIDREMDAGKKYTWTQVQEARMRRVLGCAKRVKPGKGSRQILAEMRGYDRADL